MKNSATAAMEIWDTLPQFDMLPKDRNMLIRMVWVETIQNIIERNCKSN